MKTRVEDCGGAYNLSSQLKGAIVSEKEIEILRFLNEFGFCEITHIMKRFDIKKSPAYLSMQLLIRLGLIIQSRIVQGRRGAYILTHKGIELLELDLPQVRKISLSTYYHHLAIIDLYLKLKELYPEAVWVSERRLTRNKYEAGSNKNEHLPDGILVFPEGNQCAIEVEKKSQD